MIIRAIHNRNNPYFMVRRATAQDKQLPARALGVLLYLMSKPDTWEPTIEDICRRFPDVGQRQAYKIINEVFIPLGYARRVQERDGGKITGWVTEIYETPVGENCQVEPLPDGENHHVATRWQLPDGSFDQLYINRIDTTENKELINKENTDIGADAQTAKPKPAKRQPDPRTQHVAIQLCRELVNQYPPKELWDKIIEMLGDEPDAGRLSGCRLAWVERGYNKNSWIWATEWYATGVPGRMATNQKRDNGVYVGKSTPLSTLAAAAEDGAAFMLEHIDGLIARDDWVQLGNEYDNILERGGAKAEWEVRCCAWYELHRDEPATAEQMASLNASIAALSKRKPTTEDL